MNTVINHINSPCLTYKCLSPLFSDQLERKKEFYKNITFCCAITISIAACVIMCVNLVALLAIFSSFLFLGMTLASQPVVIVAISRIGKAIGNAKIKHVRVQIEKMTKDHGLEERVQRRVLAKVIKLADHETLHALFPKMDLIQLLAAEQILGNSILRDWSKKQQSVMNPTYDQIVLQKIFAIFEGKQSRSALLNKLIEFDSSNKEAILDVNIQNEFFRILRKISDKGSRLLLACKWIQLAAAHFYQGITSTVHLSSLSINPKVYEIEIDQNLLFHCSTIMQAAQEADGLNNNLIIEVQDPESLSNILQILKYPEGYADKKFENKELKKLFLCMHQYLDQLADTLQLAFEKREVKAFCNQRIFNVYQEARLTSASFSK